MPQLPSTPSSPKQEFLRGLRESLAFVLAGIPFGLVAGLSAVEAGLAPTPAYFSHLVLHAGASQLASYQLFGEDARALIIVLTVAIINVRFVMYSASLAPYWQKHPLWVRLIAAHLITDPSYAYTMQRYMDKDEKSSHIIWYLIALAGVGFVAWSISGLIGIMAGKLVPEAWSLDFAIIALFLGLLVPAVKDKATLLAAIVGASIAIAFHALPYNLGLMLGAVSGIAAGYGMQQLLYNKDEHNKDNHQNDDNEGEAHA